MNQVTDDGECYPALPGPAYERIEAGEASLFRLIGGASEAPALWFRNSDMRVEGSNAPSAAGGSAAN